jgi:hypothetical protein
MSSKNDLVRRDKDPTIESVATVDDVAGLPEWFWPGG